MALCAMQGARMAVEEISSVISTPKPVAPSEVNIEIEPDPDPTPESAPVSEDSGKMLDLYV